MRLRLALGLVVVLVVPSVRALDFPDDPYLASDEQLARCFPRAADLPQALRGLTGNVNWAPPKLSAGRIREHYPPVQRVEDEPRMVAARTMEAQYDLSLPTGERLSLRATVVVTHDPAGVLAGLCSWQKRQGSALAAPFGAGKPPTETPVPEIGEDAVQIRYGNPLKVMNRAPNTLVTLAIQGRTVTWVEAPYEGAAEAADQASRAIAAAIAARADAAVGKRTVALPPCELMDECALPDWQVRSLAAYDGRLGWETKRVFRYFNYRYKKRADIAVFAMDEPNAEVKRTAALKPAGATVSALSLGDGGILIRGPGTGANRGKSVDQAIACQVGLFAITVSPSGMEREELLSVVRELIARIRLKCPSEMLAPREGATTKKPDPDPEDPGKFTLDIRSTGFKKKTVDLAYRGQKKGGDLRVWVSYRPATREGEEPRSPQPVSDAVVRVLPDGPAAVTGGKDTPGMCQLRWGEPPGGSTRDVDVELIPDARITLTYAVEAGKTWTDPSPMPVLLSPGDHAKIIVRMEPPTPSVWEMLRTDHGDDGLAVFPLSGEFTADGIAEARVLSDKEAGDFRFLLSIKEKDTPENAYVRFFTVRVTPPLVCVRNRTGGIARSLPVDQRTVDGFQDWATQCRLLQEGLKEKAAWVRKTFATALKDERVDEQLMKSADKLAHQTHQEPDKGTFGAFSEELAVGVAFSNFWDEWINATGDKYLTVGQIGDVGGMMEELSHEMKLTGEGGDLMGDMGGRMQRLARGMQGMEFALIMLKYVAEHESARTAQDRRWADDKAILAIEENTFQFIVGEIFGGVFTIPAWFTGTFLNKVRDVAQGSYEEKWFTQFVDFCIENRFLARDFTRDQATVDHFADLMIEQEDIRLYVRKKWDEDTRQGAISAAQHERLADVFWHRLMTSDLVQDSEGNHLTPKQFMAAVRQSWARKMREKLTWETIGKFVAAIGREKDYESIMDHTGVFTVLAADGKTPLADARVGLWRGKEKAVKWWRTDANGQFMIGHDQAIGGDQFCPSSRLGGPYIYLRVEPAKDPRPRYVPLPTKFFDRATR